MIWDDAAIGTLRQLLAEGRTYAEIAKFMGCSRNAVIGKAHRHGLSSHSKQLFAPGATAEAVAKRKAAVQARRAQSVADAVALARAGRPTDDIAREMGAHLDTVRRWLREAGESRPPRVRQRVQRPGGRLLNALREPREPRATCQPPKPRAPRPPRVVAPVVPKAPHAALRYGVTGCRWPHGEPGREGFRFCDAGDVVRGSCYCAEHHRRAYARPAVGEAWV